MKNLIEFLSGKKTYICAFASAIYALCIYLGWFQSDPAIWGLLGASGAAFMRAGVAKATIGLLCGSLLLTGCIAPVPGFGQTRQVRGNGLWLHAQGYGAVGLGSFEVSDTSYPVSTNQLFAAPYANAQTMHSTGWSPFSNDIAYETAIGPVQVDSNATSRVIVPKLLPPKVKQ